MARSFKISFDDGLGTKDVFVIKPYSEDFESLIEGFYARKPESRNKSLKYYYEDSDGDKVTLTNGSDFAIFLEQNINKIFAEINESTVWKSLNPSLLNTVTYAPPGTNVGAKSLYADEIRSIHHEGILCDVCDKDIYGFRYKCLDCEEFDMCMDCEPKQIHKEHLLLRITNPIDGEKNFHLQVLDNEDQ